MTAENEDRNAWKRPLFAHNYNTLNVKKKRKKKKTNPLVQTVSLLNNLNRTKITMGIFSTARKHKLHDNPS